MPSLKDVFSNLKKMFEGGPYPPRPKNPQRYVYLSRFDQLQEKVDYLPHMILNLQDVLNKLNIEHQKTQENINILRKELSDVSGQLLEKTQQLDQTLVVLEQINQLSEKLKQSNDSLTTVIDDSQQTIQENKNA